MSAEIQWPTEIRPDDLARIDAYFAQQKDYDTSVAWFIIDEAKKVQDEWLEDHRSPPAEIDSESVLGSALEELSINIQITSYVTAAVAVINAKQVLKGERSMTNKIYEILSLGWLNNRDDYRERLSSSLFSTGMKTWEVVAEARFELERNKRGKQLQEIGVVNFIDQYIDGRISKVNSRRPDSQKTIDAMNKGRQRFHQFRQEVTN